MGRAGRQRVVEVVVCQAGAAKCTKACTSDVRRRHAACCMLQAVGGSPLRTVDPHCVHVAQAQVQAVAGEGAGQVHLPSGKKIGRKITPQVCS